MILAPLLLAACTDIWFSLPEDGGDTSSPSGDAARDDTAPDDTAAADSGDTGDGCAAEIVDEVDATTVTVDWSARMPVDSVMLAVYRASAVESRTLLCADALTQGDLVTYEEPEVSRGTAPISLAGYEGTSLLVAVTEGATVRTWIADISSGGAATLTAE